MSQQLSEHYNRASAAIQPHYQKAQPYLQKTHGHLYPYLKPIDKELSRFPALNRFESRTGVPKAYLGVAVFSIFVFFIFFNIFASLLTNALGFFIPAYYSLKALQTPAANDDTQWLTYWTVFGFFATLEGVADHVVYWFPLYYTTKALFLVYLMLPQTRGAVVIYSNVLRPLFFKTPKGTLPQGFYSSSSPTSPASTLASKTAPLSSSAAGTGKVPTSTGVSSGSSSGVPSGLYGTGTTHAAPASKLSQSASPNSPTKKSSPPIPPRGGVPSSTSGAVPVDSIPTTTSTAGYTYPTAHTASDLSTAGARSLPKTPATTAATAPTSELDDTPAPGYVNHVDSYTHASPPPSQAAEAIHAAQTAQVLNGVQGRIPSDLQPAIDAIAHGDFAKAQAHNPFQV